MADGGNPNNATDRNRSITPDNNREGKRASLANSPSPDQYINRRQTAPTGRDLHLLKKFQRTKQTAKASGTEASEPLTSEQRARTLTGVRRQDSRLLSLPLSLGTRPSGGNVYENTSTSSEGERFRRLLEAAKRWVNAPHRTTSVDLAVAWASEDELDTDDEPSTTSMGHGGALPETRVQTRGTGSPTAGDTGTTTLHTQGSLAVEHWGEFLSSISSTSGARGDEAAPVAPRLPPTFVRSHRKAVRKSSTSPASPLASQSPTRTDGTAIVEGSSSESRRAASTAGNGQAPRLVSDSSSSRSAEDDSSASDEERSAASRSRMARKRWDLVRKTIRAISPFLKIWRTKAGWVQIAGHSGSFLFGDFPGTILKRETERERVAFTELQGDAINDFVPRYCGRIEIDVVNANGKVEKDCPFLRMQDLLCGLQSPIVMDIKMGIRTYLESEVCKPGEQPKYRNDLYQKMTKVDPHAATEEERERKSITKARYMQFREEMSSSATLGFRIDGQKLEMGFPMRDFKHVREQPDVENRFLQFLNGNHLLWSNCLQKLTQFRDICTKSDFLKCHEVVGSSLLFVGEPDSGNAGVWMIDFGKTCKVPEGITLDHFSSWELGNHEDGYLLGLDNLIRIWIGLQDRVFTAACQEAMNVSCSAVSEEGESGDMADDEGDQETVSGFVPAAETNGMPDATRAMPNFDDIRNALPSLTNNAQAPAPMSHENAT